MCSSCRCRGCYYCNCVDVAGRLMSYDACRLDRLYRQDRVLGTFDTAADCRKHCNNLIDWPAQHNKTQIDFSAATVCNTWSWSNVTRRCVGHINNDLVVSEHVDRLREYGGLAHGVATCAPPAKLRRQELPASYRFAALTTVGLFALTPGVVERLALAHAQFEGTPHLHRVVLVNTKAPNAPEAAEGLASVVSALGGDKDAVDLMDAARVEAAYPGLIARMQGVAWGDTRKPVWLSNGCDLPGLAWYALRRAKLPKDVSHVWVLQHDVGWTGSLPELLGRGFDRASDLICDGIHWSFPGWQHAAAHNHLSGEGGVLACLIPAVRYSMRLLEDQRRGMLAGNVSYCEIRAATACARAPWRCRVSSLRKSGMLGTFSAYTSADASLLQRPSTGWPSSHLLLGGSGGVGGESPSKALARRHQVKDTRCDRQLKHGSGIGRLFHRVYDDPAPLSRDCPVFCPLAPPQAQCFADDYGISMYRPYPCGPDSQWRCCASQMPPPHVE